MEFLEGLWLSDDLLLEPLDGRRFIRYKKLKLQHFSDGHTFLVVFGHLVWQEVHAIPLGEPLGKPSIKLRCGHRNGYAALYVEGNHAVEEQIVLSLGNDLGLPILRNKNWQLFKVGPDEIPDSLFSTGSDLESLLKTAVRSIGGDYKFLFDGHTC